MKKILIIGENSYIGNCFQEWMNLKEEPYEINQVSSHGSEWENVDFSYYNIVFHVAAIVHRKETKQNRELYFKINRDLPVAIAKRAKACGVEQFIFLSSMSVYGIEEGTITKSTLPEPKNAYGKSKWEAEELLRKLESNDFYVAIIRPPMVYGKNCRGNYSKLKKLAKITPVFPDVKNQRSMIYIYHLCEFVCCMIEYAESGTFCPQDKVFINTTALVREIAKNHANNIRTTKLFNPLISFMGKYIGTVNKVFGNLVYEKELSDFEKFEYCVFSFAEAIGQTEKKEV